MTGLDVSALSQIKSIGSDGRLGHWPGSAHPCILTAHRHLVMKKSKVGIRPGPGVLTVPIRATYPALHQPRITYMMNGRINRRCLHNLCSDCSETPHTPFAPDAPRASRLRSEERGLKLPKAFRKKCFRRQPESPTHGSFHAEGCGKKGRTTVTQVHVDIARGGGKPPHKNPRLQLCRSSTRPSDVMCVYYRMY